MSIPSKFTKSTRGVVCSIRVHLCRARSKVSRRACLTMFFCWQNFTLVAIAEIHKINKNNKKYEIPKNIEVGSLFSMLCR